MYDIFPPPPPLQPPLPPPRESEIKMATFKEFFKLLLSGLFSFSSVVYVTYGISLINSNHKEIKECKDSFLLEYLISYFCIVFLRMILFLYLKSKINLIPSKFYKYNCFILCHICIESMFAGWGYSQFESNYCVDGYPSDIWNFGYITYLIQISTLISCIILMIGMNLFIYCRDKDEYNHYLRQRNFPIVT